MEANYQHIESTLEKLVGKVDKIESRIYIGLGVFFALELLVNSGIIKVG